MVCSQTLQYPLQREVIAVLFLDIVTSVGRRISRAGVIITGAVLGIVAAVIVACENPQPPVSCGAIPQQTLTVGETATVSACFDDPNGDVLVYAARSSDPGVAKATGSGSSVTVTAVSPGDATVTIRAGDPDGLAAEQMFAVLVPNRPPVVVGEIADRELAVGESLTLDVPGYFSEPDGQALVYAAALGADMVEGTMTGESLTIVALAKGTAPVTLTASDLGNLTAAVAFAVTVEEHTGGNRSPMVTRKVEEQSLQPEGTFETDLDDHFRDPDGDALAFSTSNSDAAVADVEVSDGGLTVTAVAKGTAQVSVTARDLDGLSAKMDFAVTVRSPEDNQAVEVSPGTTELTALGASVELAAEAFDANGHAVAGAEFSWESSHIAVAAVDTSGLVTAVSNGTAATTASSGAASGLAGPR